jgi:tetratricopeptide (TPR) repeat protein
MRFLAVPLLALVLAAAPEDASRKAFEDASRALASNDLPAAERGFQQVLKLQRGHPGALGNLGVVYSRMGRYADAVSVYRQVLKTAPADPLLNLNIALAYMKQDDYASAKPHLQRVLHAQPGHAQARELMAAAELYTGNVASATAALEALRQSGGASVLYLLSMAYLRQNRREDAMDAVSQLFASVPPAQAHLLAGRAYYESTLFDEALAELTKAAGIDRKLPGVARELGKTYVSLRQAGDAKNALAEAVGSDPGDAEARYFLGALLVREGMIEAGVEHLEKARAARPAFWGSYYYLGRAALTSGNAAEATRLLREAARLHPDDMPVLYLLARALKASGRDDEARQVSRRLAEVRARTRNAEQEALVLR